MDKAQLKRLKELEIENRRLRKIQVEPHSYTVAVTGVGGGVGQSVLRALRRCDLPLHVVGTDAEAWSAGLYAVEHGNLVPRATDPGYGPMLKQVLAEAGAQVLIPGSDPELPALARIRDEIRAEAGTFVLVGSVESVGLCRDKMAASEFFAERGFPFVRTVPGDQAEELAKDLGFPVLLKPRGGSASRGVRVAFNKADLDSIRDRSDLIAQEYLIPTAWGLRREQLRPEHVVRGHILRQEEEISIQVVLDHQGSMLGCFTSKNTLRDGVPMTIDPWPGAPVEELAVRMVEALVDIGLVGPCNLQCKFTERGPVFFEINPRYTGITAVRAAMGFNEVEAVLKRLLLNEPLDSVRERLHVPSDQVCSRYITELVFPREDLDQVRNSGDVYGRGWSTVI
ncbi:MAG TPA: ATP-grasp domain-containing protein [Candidatus Bipolaricaulis sp.]|nr:ATP-grasp domain-containing protein [Candidatus Bipolaricaulis sp.]HRS13561.1 ATP-grasp domain-containing protein [Candidatus Bipolaricaulis sp.]HRU22009.1 ATP-grasp domain-containing protein [Candidatus Bipolaricaulis sp.]